MADIMSITEISMLNDMRHMEMISHNLANANTAGYKRDIPHANAFSTQLDAVVGNAVQQLPTTVAQLVPELAAVTDMSQGMLKLNNNPLSVAIEGEGYFELNTDHGTLYSRGGEFGLNAAGTLVSAEGYTVSGLQGDIRLLGNNPRIDGQGKVWEDEELVGQLKLVQFDKQAQITKVGQGLFSVNGVARTLPEATRVRQGFVETGNVNATDEMIRMMTTVRHFEMSQRVITGYDEMVGQAISTLAEF